MPPLGYILQPPPAADESNWAIPRYPRGLSQPPGGTGSSLARLTEAHRRSSLPAAGRSGRVLRRVVRVLEISSGPPRGTNGTVLDPVCQFQPGPPCFLACQGKIAKRSIMPTVISQRLMRRMVRLSRAGMPGSWCLEEVCCFLFRVDRVGRLLCSLAAHLEPGFADDLEHAVPDFVRLPPDGHEGIPLFAAARLVEMRIVLVRVATRPLVLVFVLAVLLLALTAGLDDLVRARLRPGHDELLVLVL